MAEQSSNNVVSLAERKSKAPRISKLDVLATAEKVEDEYIEELDLVVPMRRLNDVESTEIQTAMSDGVEVERDGEGNVTNMKVDVARQAQAERFARRDAIASALSVNDEEYLVEEVSMFPPNYVTHISDRVFSLSGLTNEHQEAIKSVREDEGGGADSVDAPAGGAAGEGSADADGDTGDVPSGSPAASGDEA